jgi:hypothetical protein
VAWACATCGAQHESLPLYFAVEAPWRSLVPPEEFAARVVLDEDRCMVDRQVFVRGHLEIPIHGWQKPLVYSVWASLSEKSALYMDDRWSAPDRANDAPYFGWFCSALPNYPETVHLKVSVQSRQPGVVPLFTLEPTDHPLSLEQHQGITIERWHAIAHALQQDA